MSKIEEHYYRNLIERDQVAKEIREDELRKTRRNLLIILGIALIVALFLGKPASAAPVENDGGIEQGLFNHDFNNLPNDEEAYYQIDYSNTTQEEQENSGIENAIDGIANFNPIKDTFTDNLNEGIMFFINWVFEINKMMTSLMIGLLDFAYNTNIINSVIDVFDGVVGQISGISGTTVSGGLFGPLLGLALLFSAAYAGIQLVGSRGILASIQTLCKAVVALTLAFLIVAEFGTIMKGLNEASSALSALVLAGGSNVISGENQTQDELRESVSENLWNEFIGRPYLVMQYGNDDVEDVGESRVNELLALKPGDDRTTYVEETEIGERGNEIMTSVNLMQRAAFSLLYTVINMLVSLPIFLLAFALIVVQLWFLLIAFYAPFALIQSVFPGQFPVLRRYAVELIYPLAVKLILTGLTFFIFTAGFMIYSINVESNIAIYFVAAVLELAVFSVVFIFRKPIIRIMSAGSAGPFAFLRQDIQGLRHSMDQTTRALTKTASYVGAAASGGTSAVVTKAAVETVKAAGQSETTVDNSGTAATAKMDQSEPVREEKIHPYSRPLASIHETPTEPTPEPETEQKPKKDVDLSKPFASIDYKLNVREANEAEGEPRERKEDNG